MTESAGTVLVLRALGLGDALTGVPALRGLRRAFPDRRLLLAAPHGIGAWLVRLGVIDAVLPTPGLRPLDWSGDPPELAVDLHGCGPESRRLIHDVEPQRMLAFGCEPSENTVCADWDPDEQEVLRWCRLVREVGADCGPEDLRLSIAAERRSDRVVIHPGAASGSRRWPRERWVPVARALAEDGYRVVLTGSADEADLCAYIARAVSGAVNTAGVLDLDALTSLVAGARLTVCGDTGVAHLATACATPSVLLFGPTPPHRWGPAIDAPLHTVLWHGDLAAGVWGDPHSSVVDPRLDAITVAEVLDAVQAQLSAHGDQRVASGHQLADHRSTGYLADHQEATGRLGVSEQ